MPMSKLDLFSSPRQVFIGKMIIKFISAPHKSLKHCEIIFIIGTLRAVIITIHNVIFITTVTMEIGIDLIQLRMNLFFILQQKQREQ